MSHFGARSPRRLALGLLAAGAAVVSACGGGSEIGGASDALPEAGPSDEDGRALDAPLSDPGGGSGDAPFGGADADGEPTPPEDGGEDPGGTGGEDTVGDGAGGSDCPGGFGCSCSANEDCFSGFCIEGRDGLVCTQTCEEACPDGFECRTTGSGGADPTSICVPRHVRLCRPCNEDEQCSHPLAESGAAHCLPAGSDPANGSFCASPCEGGETCPEGFTCSPINLPEGGEVEQCVPVDGTCECRPSWSDKGFETTCLLENEHGSCEGTRSCGAQGLTDCEGPVPASETCNGEDDDCNGTIDDIPQNACKIESQHGTCEGVETCSDGEVVCDASEPVPESCNGVDDDCDGTTDEEVCDDGLPCTSDACEPETGCSHAIEAGWCVIDGSCVEAGTVNPADPCERCQPEVATEQWSDADGEPCDDGEPCTANDTCENGTCAGEGYTCNDGLACTDDVCDGSGGCDHPIASNSCLIDGVCRDALESKPGDPCRVCNPSQPEQWSPASEGTPCDDGDPCTYQDACGADGTCQGIASPCDDGLYCTKDVCDGEGGCTHEPLNACVIDGACVAEGTSKPGDPCMVCKPAQSTETWSPATGASCDDGNPCTMNDTCSAGTCTGTPYDCDDGPSCTEDQCDGQGGCTSELKPGFCEIAGQCYQHGTPNPLNECEVCQPSSDPNGWTDQSGTSCDDGDPCTEDDTCQNGQCEGTPKTDDMEPNDSEFAAHELAGVNNGSGDAVHQTTASLHPEGDVDWYRFTDEDTATNAMDPNAELTDIPPNADYRLCAYFETDRTINCRDGSKTTFQGHTGCCSDKSGSQSEKVEITFDCIGKCFGDDTGQMYLRVDHSAGSATTCESYTLAWGDSALY